MRLQKFLAEAGVASRRKAEEMIAQGRVAVNGQTVTEMGIQVDPKDTIALDGKAVHAQTELVYIMLHKPEGYISTTHDQFNRPSVLDLLPEQRERVYPVGRLDFDTSGLLLLTNDGALTQALTHPSHEVEKVYIARVKGVPTPKELEDFRTGLIIKGEGEDYRTAPAGIHIYKHVPGEGASLKITIHEGRNRQVRKMCEAIGHPVIFLKRVATGKIYLGDLPRGAHRPLTKDEIRYLKGL